MSPAILFAFVIGYFLLLLTVAWYTSRGSNNESFFIGNKKSNWMLVAFGMIGTSLSGVTFVSVPGGVGTGNFFYFQVVLGYLLGYIVIAFVLLPLYYKMNLTSIYTYLETRFGVNAHKVGASFFILSRVVGATARLYLVINVLQIFILNKLGIPFVATTFVILLMILLYTFEGGVKTIIYTDTLQTTGMLFGLVVCIFVIIKSLGTDFSGTLQLMNDNGYTKIFNTDVKAGSYFMKHILGGMFIAIAMTGLDQEMMQKNISVKRLVDSQKNVSTLAVILVSVLCLFLFLGGLLYLYGNANGGIYQDVLVNGKMVKQFILNDTNVIGDKAFPSIVLHYFPPAVGIIFIIALISALFPSADGALTALTSSFCIDIIGLKSRDDLDEKQQKKWRLSVHLCFTILFLICIMGFKVLNDNSIIDKILDLAGYTYGPLLGLFALGIFTKRQLPNSWIVTLICLIAPLLSYVISVNAKNWLNGYQIGIELLIINGILTFVGLWIIGHSNNLKTKSR